MSNTPDQRTANMVHFPNKDETDPNALDEYLDNLVTGSGFVAITGTPVDNQVAVWTSATNIEGTTGLTYDGSSFGVTGNITVSGTVDGVDIAARDHGGDVGGDWHVHQPFGAANNSRSDYRERHL